MIRAHGPMAPNSTPLTFWQWFLGRPRTRADHLDALDGLRGLAVLIVLGSHLSNAGLLPAPGLAGSGKSGVYLFFVLSAFLLTRALLQRPPAAFADGRLWADYALRRVLRIWPLYLVVLLTSWMLTTAQVNWHYVLDTAALWRHLTLQEGQSVLWSIPVEFTFYLWLPLLAFALACMQVRRWPLWAEGVVALLALATATHVWPPAEAQVNDVRLGPYLVVFLCGAFAAQLDHRMRDASTPRRQGAWALAGLAGLAACVLAVPSVWAFATGRAFDPSVSHTWFVWFGVAWSLLLLGVLHGPHWLRAPFASVPLRLIGVVSFSAYLWHMPVLEALQAAGVGRWPWLAPWLVLLVALVVAMASFLLFERPWREVRLPRAVRPHSVPGAG